MSEPGPWAEALGRVAFEFAQFQPFLPTFIHTIASALFPIVAGAHASLSCPSSATRKSKKANPPIDNDVDDEEPEEVQPLESLGLMDAITIPLAAAASLGGLYYLTRVLEDFSLVNKILNWYMAIFAVIGLSGLISDVLMLGHSLVLPMWFAFDGEFWRVDATARQATNITAAGKGTRVRQSPLPGFLGGICPSSLNRILWTCRDMGLAKWTVKFYIRGLFRTQFHFGLTNIVGAILGLTTVWFYNFVYKNWVLTNLTAFAFAYSAIQLVTPTDFKIGSLILMSLFVYDIVMVFYTPMMITVAKAVEAPIMLQIPRPAPEGAPPGRQYHSILGLGDVIVPGLMMSLALRFDLYLHYLRKQTPGENGMIKAQYVSPCKNWANYFWTSTWIFPRELPTPLRTGSFSKTYFTASVVGYVLGMTVTTAVMHIYKHGQPALLYLVPTVLIAIWGTALVRGEIGIIWKFTEESVHPEAAEKETKGSKRKLEEASDEKELTSDQKEAKSDQKEATSDEKEATSDEDEKEAMSDEKETTSKEKEATSDEKVPTSGDSGTSEAEPDKSKASSPRTPTKQARAMEAKIKKLEQKLQAHSEPYILFFAIERHASQRHLRGDIGLVPKWTVLDKKLENYNQRSGKRLRTK
ncbi:hypothetical protein EJ06DRAFT_196450 [Trichodelitschia bisporula]|uniref:Peptidase A22B, signal peptide peptidase n=1 Tax=Trichodelitschia bisporula TaxID=703511 RepID=A0A6G1I7S1_9PEZI|nr:hypothetical protein EJ06DRAFT_196450 [Trichodelitschia bisporula]